jgi:hypothetical protein
MKTTLTLAAAASAVISCAAFQPVSPVVSCRRMGVDTPRTAPLFMSDDVSIPRTKFAMGDD